MIFAVIVFFFTKQFNFPIEHENKNTVRTGVPFRLSPDPLLPALSNLRALICSPAPRAWDEQVSVDLRGAGGGLACLPVPRAVPLSHFVRSLLLSDPQAGGVIAMCAVFVSSFSCVIR